MQDATDLTGSPFLKNTWYVAGWLTEFEPHKPSSRTIADEPVVLYRRTDGRLVALTDRCPHRWAPLSLGRIEGDDIRCMYHGAKFADDGRCLEVPGQDRIASSLCARAFPVIERHRFVWIWMGDSGLADQSKIPDLSMLDDDGRNIRYGSLDYAAHYSLICDNLLDLSHFAFLHEKTLGRPTVHSDVPRKGPRNPSGVEAKSIPDGVRVEGWLAGKASYMPTSVQDGDFWSRVDFLVPGIYVSHGRMFDAGTADRYDGGEPEGDGQPSCDLISIQALTPISARETRYFYSFGSRRSDMTDEELDGIWAIVLEAFSEDLQMIQAQQQMIDCHPGDKMGGIAADRGLTLFRSRMKKLIAAESK